MNDIIKRTKHIISVQDLSYTGPFRILGSIGRFSLSIIAIYYFSFVIYGATTEVYFILLVKLF